MLGFDDGDNYVEPGMYEELVARILEDGSDFVHSLHISEREDQSIIEGHISDTVKIFARKADREAFIKEQVLEDAEKIIFVI